MFKYALVIAVLIPSIAFPDLCGSNTERVYTLATGVPQTVGTGLTNRKQITVCSSNANTATSIVQCRGDGGTVTLGDSNVGIQISRGQCRVFGSPSTTPISCVSNESSVVVKTEECTGTAPPTTILNPAPAIVTVSGTITANQGTAGASSWPVKVDEDTTGATKECLVKATAGGTACPTTALANRKAIKLTNNGPNRIWCALGSSVPVVNIGDPIDPSGWASYGGSMAVTCIAETADQVTTAATIVSEIGQ